jgi:flagellar basal body-associated protein FliL
LPSVFTESGGGTQPKSKLKRGIIITLIVAGVAVVIGIIVGIVWFNRRRARDAEVRRFV